MSEIDFETGLNELQSLAKQLEDESLSLKERIDKFERGMEIARICEKYLDEAQGRIEQVMKKNGKIVTTPFE